MYKIKNGKCYNKKGEVAVAYSPNFGAGWSTWNYGKVSPLDGDINKKILEGRFSGIDDEDKILEIINEGREIPLTDICVLAFTSDEKMVIEWFKPGNFIEIEEFDGSESIKYLDFCSQNKYVV